ncbi:hypothetical protein PYW07_015819 [Mythimna separata]|uniref:Cytochrome P450 CYP12A2-like n=1 Tax=Mythimna separata TaxID=271217 RepID=A0AAD7YS50_MYTSE|nr:hypothetical protein PYW07_015819 [Mythimna separata]
MQTSKFKSLFNFAVINKNCIRTATETGTATRKDKIKPWKEIPGPPSLPFLGQLHHFMPGGAFSDMRDPLTTMRLIETYGPIIRLDSMFGKRPLMFLSDPESVELVLRSESSYPIRPGFDSLEYYRKVYRKRKGIKFHATGLLSDHGEVWQEFRSIVNPVMLQPKTIKLYTTVLDEVAQDMIKRMRSNRDENYMITKELDKEMNLWALESIGTVALGCRLNCLEPNLSTDSPEWKLIQCVHELFTTANQIDFIPSLWRLIPTPLYNKVMKAYEKHENLTKYFIKKGKDNMKNKSDTEKAVLEKLLEINEEAAHIMASDMLFAGVDTASNTVIATLYLLAQNQKKQDKLREEIMSKSERKPYLRACIKESLRLMPVVAGNARRTTKVFHILGYEVPKGVDIIFAHREMSMMEKYFPRANEYIPERWIAAKDDPLHYGKAHPFVYVPFGFGARACIGRRIAELEMETFVARLIENFQVYWFGPPPKTVQHSLNYIKGPYNFVFKDIK